MLESPSSTILASPLPSLCVSTKQATSSGPPPLAPLTPLAHPVAPPCNLDPPWDFESPSLAWHMDYLAPPRPSEPTAPPWTIDQSAPHGGRRPVGFTGLPYPTGSTWVNRHHGFPACLLPSSPPATSGSSIPQASLGYLLTLGSPWSISPQALPWPLVAGTLGSSDFTWKSPSPCVTSVGRAQVSTVAPLSISSTLVLAAFHYTLDSHRPSTQSNC